MASISLNGDDEDINFTVKLDFSKSNEYDDLRDVSTSKIRSFLSAVKSRIEYEIEDTDCEGADISGRLYDNDRNSYYVDYSKSGSCSYSWD